MFKELNDILKPMIEDKQVTSLLCLNVECAIIRHLEENNYPFPFIYGNQVVHQINVLPDIDNPCNLRIKFLSDPIMKKKKELKN